MRTRIAVLVGSAAVLAALTTAAPAYAAPTGDSVVTFEVTAGTLDITVPATADIGAGTPGSSASGPLGTVTVTDGRADLTAAWTTSASSTDFTTGGATAAETIPIASLAYWSGAATATTGSGTFTPGQVNAGAAEVLTGGVEAMVLSAGVGNNTASWNPTLVVAAPAAAVAGVYTGTVTHSVA